MHFVFRNHFLTLASGVAAAPPAEPAAVAHATPMVSAELAAAAEAALEAGEAAAAAGDVRGLTLAHDPDYVTAQEWIQTLTKQQALGPPW